MKEERIAIIGAGIAGLSAAWRLKQQGFDPVVFEASDYVGGRIKSFRRGDFLFDVGAFIYLGSYNESVALMKEAGLEEQLDRFDAYGAMPRDGQLNFLDLNKPLRTILGTEYISNVSKLKCIKLFWLLARHWKDLNYEDATGIAEVDNDTVASYCRRELNEEIYQYLASVVVRGPWLTNPETTSMAQLLWTLKNFFKPWFYGLDEGMDALPRALADAVDVRLQCPVINLTDNGSNVEITYKAEGREVTESFSSCVMTTTTDRILEIYPQVEGVKREFFETTEYITSVNTHICLSQRPKNPATYMMVSPRENPDLCGVIVDHLKANNRAPADKGQMTVFCRTEWCQDNLETPSENVLEKVLEFIRPYYGDLTEQVEDYEIGRWPRVVPVMKQGRFREVAKFQKTLNSKDRVQYAGDLVPMGGVNAALVSGQKAAQRVVEHFG